MINQLIPSSFVVDPDAPRLTGSCIAQACPARSADDRADGDVRFSFGSSEEPRLSDVNHCRTSLSHQ